MINSLTQQQIDKFPLYVSEWTARGLTTTRKLQEDAEKDFANFQRHVLKMKNPAPVVIYDSPSKCREAMLSTGNFDDRSRNQVRNQVGNQVRNQVVNRVWNQVRNQVGNQVWNHVWNQVRNQVGSQVWNQVRNRVIIYPHFCCQFWANFFSFYEFFKNELGIKYSNSIEYESLLACQPYGMMWSFKNLCVVCQPPSIIKTNEHGLHCEDGPALSYNGDNEIWSLNGVTVPKELVTTPSEELSIEFLKSEKNADVRTEFVRKYGVERMLDMGKLVDSYENYPDQNTYSWWWKSEYELWDMAAIFDGIPYQPYIKMMNQTTKIWHVEAVSPSCRTLSDAIKERFGGRDLKIVNIA